MGEFQKKLILAAGLNQSGRSRSPLAGRTRLKNSKSNFTRVHSCCVTRILSPPALRKMGWHFGPVVSPDQDHSLVFRP
jgi:hypothetical protein